MSLVILEGCDGVGKTTIAKNLAAMTGARIIHCTKETKNDFHFFMQIILISREQNIIMDRAMYGQFVYQTADERRERKWLDLDDLECLEMAMLSADAQVFLVYEANKKVEERLARRNETVINELKVGDVQLKFWDFLSSRTLIEPMCLRVNDSGVYEIYGLKGDTLV